MSGPELKEYITEKKIHRGLLAKKANIPYRTIGDRYKDEEISLPYMKKFRIGIKALTGIENFDLQPDSKLNEDINTEIVLALKLTISHQGKKIKNQGEKIKRLEIEKESLIKEFNDFKKEKTKHHLTDKNNTQEKKDLIRAKKRPKK